MPGVDYTKNQERRRIFEPVTGAATRTIPLGQKHSGLIRQRIGNEWATQSVRIGRTESEESKERLRELARQTRSHEAMEGHLRHVGNRYYHCLKCGHAHTENDRARFGIHMGYARRS